MSSGASGEGLLKTQCPPGLEKGRVKLMRGLCPWNRRHGRAVSRGVG